MSIITIRPGTLTIDELRELQVNYSHIIITAMTYIDKILTYYPTGIYYITPENVYPVKSPAFLRANNLVKSD
jgi:hypothetical protein